MQVREQEARKRILQNPLKMKYEGNSQSEMGRSGKAEWGGGNRLSGALCRIRSS
jgi:hypothetical protein